MKTLKNNNQKKQRVLILHGHLFKNAGSTFDWSLQQNFGERFLDHRDDAAMRLGHKYLRPFIRNNPELVAISSHHMQLPAPKVDDLEILPVILLRHPIERIRSVYNFERKQDASTTGSTVGSTAASEKSFSDYVHWRMQPDTFATIRDLHVRACTRMRVRAHKAVNEKRFARAIAFIQNTRMTGVVERYDESMVVFEHYLKDFFDDINLAYVRQNVSEKNQLPLAQGIDSVLNALNKETRELVLQNNYFDLALYKEANDLLDQRIADIDNFAARLLGFRGRCQKLTRPGNSLKHWIKKFING